MKHLVALIFLASGLAAFGQIQGDFNDDGCVQLEDLLGLLGAFGNCDNEQTSWYCGLPFEYQGHAYETTLIEDRCWFAENLRSTQYANGDNVAMPISESQWIDCANIGATCDYRNLEGIWENTTLTCAHYNGWSSEMLIEVFGRYYNRAAILDSRNVCPSGWSVPTDLEWLPLYQGGAQSVAVNDSTAAVWCSNQYQESTDLNEFQFSALPGGRLNGAAASEFGAMQADYLGIGAFFWSIPIAGTAPQVVAFSTSFVTIPPLSSVVWTASSNYGLSVRCIQDAE